MTASEARQMVREEYPMARLWHSPVIGYVVSHRDEDVDYSDGDTSEDAAWISAASRLPAPKPIEPAQVESGDGLPYDYNEVDISKAKEVMAERDRAGFKYDRDDFLHTLSFTQMRERQLKASLQRERELVGLLKDVLDGYSDELSLSDKLLIKAAITEKVSSR